MAFRKCKQNGPDCRLAAGAITEFASPRFASPRFGVVPLKIAALIVAAGKGIRAGGGIPKQYAGIGGQPVLRRTVEAFLSHAAIDSVTVVISPDDRSLYDRSLPQSAAKLRAPAAGGATRQQSVHAGLEALSAAPPDLVLIHDAARPFVTPATISAVIAALDGAPGAIAAVPLADTLKRQGASGFIASTLDRAGLWRAQTPQGFRFDAILSAHRKAAAQGKFDFTDDAAIAEWSGLDVALVEDGAENIKLTTAADLEAAERSLKGLGNQGMETRTGQGFDIHRFAQGDHVWLCGVKIPHTHKLDGHSDADAALHALTDALLGTIGDGDIGQHFPPSDPKWKGAASRLFLEDAARRVAERGGRIVNVDVTILAEAPKVGPHRAAMQAVIGAALGLTADRIGIKATTMEQLGAIGRRDGIAALAIATVQLPI